VGGVLHNPKNYPAFANLYLILKQGLFLPKIFVRPDRWVPPVRGFVSPSLTFSSLSAPSSRASPYISSILPAHEDAGAPSIGLNNLGIPHSLRPPVPPHLFHLFYWHLKMPVPLPSNSRIMALLTATDPPDQVN
jgi:hypothetical protein